MVRVVAVTCWADSSYNQLPSVGILHTHHYVQCRYCLGGDLDIGAVSIFNFNVWLITSSTASAAYDVTTPAYDPVVAMSEVPSTVLVVGLPLRIPGGSYIELLLLRTEEPNRDQITGTEFIHNGHL